MEDAQKLNSTAQGRAWIEIRIIQTDILEPVHVEHQLCLRVRSYWVRARSADPQPSVHFEQALGMQLPISTHGLGFGHRSIYSMDAGRRFKLPHIVAQGIKRPRLHQLLRALIYLPLLGLTLLASRPEDEFRAQTILVSLFALLLKYGETRDPSPFLSIFHQGLIKLRTIN